MWLERLLVIEYTSGDLPWQQRRDPVWQIEAANTSTQPTVVKYVWAAVSGYSENLHRWIDLIACR
jgi:hypothetical protein